MPEKGKKKKEKQKFFSPDFPAAAPRFGARAGFPAREAARTFGGAWNPLPVPGESRARGFPRLGACKRRGSGLQPDPSPEVVVVPPPSLRPLDTERLNFSGPLCTHLSNGQATPASLGWRGRFKKGGGVRYTLSA